MEIQLNIIIVILAFIALNVWLIRINDGSEKIKVVIERCGTAGNLILLLAGWLILVIYTPGASEHIGNLVRNIFDHESMEWIGPAFGIFLLLAMIGYLVSVFIRFVKFIGRLNK